MFQQVKKYLSEEIKELKRKIYKSIKDTMSLKKMFDESMDQICSKWLQNLETLDYTQENMQQQSKNKFLQAEEESQLIKSLTESLLIFDEFRIKLFLQIGQYQSKISHEDQKQFFSIKNENTQINQSSGLHEKTQIVQRLEKNGNQKPILKKLPEISNQLIKDDQAQCLLCLRKNEEKLGALYVLQFQYEQYPIHKGCAFWSKGIFYSEKGNYVYIKNRKSINKAFSKVHFFLFGLDKTCAICGQIGATIQCQICEVTILHYPCMIENNLGVINEETQTYRCDSHDEERYRSRSRNEEDQRSVTYFFKTSNDI